MRKVASIHAEIMRVASNWIEGDMGRVRVRVRVGEA